MNDKIVKVIFEEGWETQFNESLVQWSYGHVLQIEGLTLPDGNIEVHFSLTENNGNASVLIGTVENNIITVKFPDYLLAKENTYQPSYDAWAWIYLTDEDSGQTIRKIVFTIETRAKPDDYIYTEEEIKLWSKLEKELEGVQEKQDFVAEYNVTPYSEIKDAYERGCDVRVKYKAGTIEKLEAGTYDADGNLLQTWDELMDAWSDKYPQFNGDVSATGVYPPSCVSNVISKEAEMLIISDTVTNISSFMFYSFGPYANLRRIVIPESVTHMGASSFNYHQNLETVVIANSEVSCNSAFVGINGDSIIYYSGTIPLATLIGTYNTTVQMLPYEQAPNEALGIVDSTYNLLGSLEVINNDFVFYTTDKDGKTLKMVCNADGWSSEEIEHAKKSEIPTKTSQLENDSGYVDVEVATNEAKPYTLVKRTAKGRIVTGAPEEDFDATTKKYVDDNFIQKATFTAVYGQTKYEEIEEAAKKYNVLVQQNGIIAPMTRQISASNTTTPYPAYMNGYKHVTISDFVDTDGNQMTEGAYSGESDGALYKYSLKDEDTFDKVMISMKVKWSEGTYKNRIDIGGNGDWSGFSIQPNADGSKLEIRDNYGMADDGYDTADMTSDIAGIDSFIGNEFLLQIGFNYTSDSIYSYLQMSVYINGVLYNNTSFSMRAPKNKGNRLNIYSEVDTATINVSSVNVEDWFDKIKFASVQESNGEYYILEASCNRLPDGSTVWTNNGIAIPQDYVTSQMLQEKSTAYKNEYIPQSGTFNLREKSFYIFCGYGYDLNLYDMSENLIGEDNCLSIILFCTEADSNGNFNVFAMQNYKGSLGVSSITSLVLSNWNGNAYVKNTNTSNAATVFYMRQNQP